MTDRQVTLIDVFTVSPARQRELMQLLAEATDESVRNAEGFVSSRLLQGLDGTTVTLLEVWRSREDYAAVRIDARESALMHQATTFANVTPGLYTLVRTFTPEEPIAWEE